MVVARRKFVVNGMAYRHTPQSGFSHFVPHPALGTNPFEALLEVVEREWNPADDTKPVFTKVVLNADTMARYGQFWTSLVTVNAGMRLHGYFASRKGGIPGELQYLHANVYGSSKQPAAVTEIIVYNQAALNEPERTHDGVLLDADFHIISLNCNPTTGNAPPPPVTVMRNHSALVAAGSPEAIGGTGRETDWDAYLESILYWRDKLQVMPVGETPPQEDVKLNVAGKFKYSGLAAVDVQNMHIEAFFAPVFPGGVEFVQFRSPNASGVPGHGEPRPRSPYELACIHAKFLGLPEGRGVTEEAFIPTAEEYRQAVLLYSTHVQVGVG